MTDAPPPSITAVRMNGAKHRAELPLLVLGPAHGTSAMTLWADCAAQLGDAFDVLAWDLPGHGYNVGVPDEPFTVGELAAGVLAVVDDVLAERSELGGSFAYAGVGVGSEVGMRLRADAPTRVRDVVRLDYADPGAIRRQLLGEAPPDEHRDPIGRLTTQLAALADAARADGVSDAEIRAALQRLEAELG